MDIQIDKIKLWAKTLKSEITAIYFALKHDRTPLYAKIVIAIIIGYALSPIDLIPDFIPVIGYLDDLILLPLGLMLAIRLIPEDVLNECRELSKNNPNQNKPKNWFAALVIVILWCSLFLLLGLALIQMN